MLETGLAIRSESLSAAAMMEPASTFSFHEGLSAAFRRKYWLLIAVVLPPAVAIALIFIMPPTYRAQTTLMVKTGREYLSEGTSDTMQSGPTITKLEEINSEIELMQDRSVIEDTINTIGINNLYPGLLQPSVLDFIPTRGSAMDRAVKKFLASLDVKLVKMSNVLDVGFSYEGDREMATKTMNAYIAAYLKRHAAVFTSGRASSFANSIEHDRTELEGLTREQGQIKIDNRIYDIAAQRTALIAQRVDAEAHLHETTDRKAALEKRIAYLAGVGGSVTRTLTSTETAPNEAVIQATETLTALRQTESGLLARYAPANPDVQRVRGQIAALQRSIRELKASSVKVSVLPGQLPQQLEQELVMDHAELGPLADEVARYEALLKTYNGELQRLEKADMDLRLVDSRIDGLNDNLKSLRAQYDVIRTEDEMDRQRLASVVALAPALTPLKPAQPTPLLLVGGGMLLGLLIAGGMAVWSMITSPVLFTAEAAGMRLGLPILATVPMLREPRKKVALRDP